MDGWMDGRSLFGVVPPCWSRRNRDMCSLKFFTEAHPLFGAHFKPGGLES